MLTKRGCVCGFDKRVSCAGRCNEWLENMKFDGESLGVSLTGEAEECHLKCLAKKRCTAVVLSGPLCKLLGMVDESATVTAPHAKSMRVCDEGMELCPSTCFGGCFPKHNMDIVYSPLPRIYVGVTFCKTLRKHNDTC
jgi:hypothetical protein